MPFIDHEIRIFPLIVFILLVHNGSAFITSLSSNVSTNSCTNISINNVPFGIIHSLNFYSGQSQPPNVSCSWTITNPKTVPLSSYIISLRVIELENDPIHWSNEITFSTGNRLISIDDVKKRTFILPSFSSSIQINFRTKPPLLQNYNPIRTNLRIRRFLLEFVHAEKNLTINQYDNKFSCLSNEIAVPKRWRCNCMHECSSNNQIDENICPLCSIYNQSNGLLCQSDEYWCLPNTNSYQNNNNNNLVDVEYDDDDWMLSHIRYSQKIDPKGVCIPRTNHQQCSFLLNSSSCQQILALRQDFGEIIINRSMIENNKSLCFIIIARDAYKLKLVLSQNNFPNEQSDHEVVIYDGSTNDNQIFSSLDWSSKQEIIQTRQNHIATILIHQRLKSPLFSQNQYQQLSKYNGDDDVIGYFDTNRTKDRMTKREDANSNLLNITWFMSICLDGQKLCSGTYEKKCYTKLQQCDGVWDCINGDDELGCSESCPTTFACNDRLRLPSDQPRCYTWSERCNGNSFCTNRTDEKLCTNWWCNSNNGTFLCKNLNCIYETWVCDGTDDCGDRSDEINCPSRIPRRIVTAAVIGATICSTLFIIALGCTCKLFHLRSAERLATSRLLNPQQYIEQRRQQIQREQHRRLNRRNRGQTELSQIDNSSNLQNETRRIAPPSYNQTMGLVDENEERQAALFEHLRLSGLANYIALPSIYNSSRTSRSTSRHRHRRHRRYRHQHQHRRTQSDGSRVALLEPNVVVSNNTFSTPSTSLSLNQFNRFRSQLRSLFTFNRTDITVPNSLPTSNNHRSNNNSSQINSISNRFDTGEHNQNSVLTSTQPIILASRPYVNSDFIQSRELPPPYSEEHLVPSNLVSTPIINNHRHDSTGTENEMTVPTTTTSSSVYRMRKRHIPIHTLRDRMRQFISGTTVRVTTDDYNSSFHTTTATTPTTLDISLEEQAPAASIEDDEQPSSGDDDKILTP